MKKIKITKDNFFIKSKADFKKVEKAPNNAPDYTSYKTFIVWEHEVWGVDKDENGEVICVHFDVEDFDDDWGYDIVSYDVVDTFIGKYGDTGYRCIDKNSITSKYWYTDEGVYRESDHWGKCRSCYWTLDGNDDDEERVVGFCRWEDFEGEIEIDSVGFYRTRNGMKARVDSIRKDDDFPTYFPVVGAVYLPEADRWKEESWTINGSLLVTEESFFDIVDEWKEESVEVDKAMREGRVKTESIWY